MERFKYSQPTQKHLNGSIPHKYHNRERNSGHKRTTPYYYCPSIDCPASASTLAPGYRYARYSELNSSRVASAAPRSPPGMSPGSCIQQESTIQKPVNILNILQRIRMKPPTSPYSPSRTSTSTPAPTPLSAPAGIPAAPPLLSPHQQPGTPSTLLLNLTPPTTRPSSAPKAHSHCGQCPHTGAFASPVPPPHPGSKSHASTPVFVLPHPSPR